MSNLIIKAKMLKKLIKEYGINMEKYYNEHEHCEKKLDDEFIRKQLINIAIENSKLALHDGIPVAVQCVPHLYIGSIGSAYTLKSLQNVGITHILCLSDCIFLKFPEHFKYLRVVLHDKQTFSFLSRLEECFDFIEEGKNHNGKVLVHCYQGKSRSCAVCCAYLMKFHNFTLIDALTVIQQNRPIAQPNTGFMQQLREYESQLKLTTVQE